MDRANRNELVKTIESQQEKLKKYESKFRGEYFNQLYKYKCNNKMSRL